MKYLIYTGIILLGLTFMSCAAKPVVSKNAMGESDQLSLMKPEGIIGIYWKLVELNGNLILNDNDTKEPHFELKSPDNRITGNGGCNGFGGTYILTKGNGIRITNLISTKMACVEITYESEFLNVLAKADNYFVKGDSLLLNINDKVLAKFVGKNK